MEGKPLFPDRFAYTVPYDLSPEEAALYKNATEYVCEQFNRADNLDNEKTARHGRRFASRFFNAAWLPRRKPSSITAPTSRTSRRPLARGTRRGAAASDRLSQSPDLEEEDIDDLEDAPEEELENRRGTNR